MSQKALWNWLKDRLPEEGHYSRIESETSPGFPDVHYTVNGVSGTIELKDGGDRIRDSQKIWIADEIESGGTVWLCRGFEKSVYFLSGTHASALNSLDEWKIKSIAMLEWPRRSRDEIGARKAALLVLLMNKFRTK